MRTALLHGWAGFALILLLGCESEPDFDERYAKAEQQIRTKAREIDAQLQEGTAERDTAELPGQEEDAAR
jgi:hypothetical protein